jgi:nicotinic acid phosphoribosyltransferase
MRRVNLKDMLRKFPVLIELLSMLTYCVIIWGYIRHIKLSKELKKQHGTEIVRKETLDKLKSANRLIIIGFITVIVIRIIGVLINIE